MTDIREYIRKKEKQNDGRQSDFNKQILAHRMHIIIRTVLIVGIVGALAAVVYVQLKNQTYSGYVVVSSVDKTQYSGTTVLNYQNGFVTYSKDGISYTDYKGNAMWNQTYQMQSPIVSVRDKWVAVGDYNGHIIYDINLDGSIQEIDTNLPIRQLAVSANGVVAVILEDSNVTWINVYNPSGEKAVGIRTTMQKSGYPMSLSLSETGKLMQVTYLQAQSGSMKSVVSFYNFDEVGQNYTDTMVSSYEYANSVIPFSAFMNASTSFAVADNQFLLFGGSTEIPKNIFQNFMTEQIRDIYYNESYVGLVFDGTDGAGKYRVDIYDQTGNQVLSLPFNQEYKDIIFTKDNVIIYNEAECVITGLNGKERFSGSITEQTLLLKPLGGNRFLTVTQDALNVIEMK